MARTYREAGVDIDAASDAVARIARLAARTHGPQVLGGIGGFGGLYALAAGERTAPVLVASTDGVGTKLKVAAALGRWETVGIDLVHHCVNDVAVAGAEPLFLLDYIGTGRVDPDTVAAIVGGIAEACASTGVALLGGETAEMPDLYAPGDVDLVGTLVGIVDRDAIVDGSSTRPGDLVLGLPSSGLHTNGYSLARRVLPEAIWGEPLPGEATTIGEALLAPHRSYLREIRDLRAALREGGDDVRGFAHLTGGGWIENIPRTLPDGLGVEVDAGSWTVPAIFSLIQQRGDIADDEMVRTFNLGIGLTAVVPEAARTTALAALPEATVVGRVVEAAPDGPRVRFA